MQRVSKIKGEIPVLLVSPHYEEENINFITELIAKEMSAFAVINRGWKKNKIFNYSKDLANCNNTSHIKNEVINEEFLEPILRFISYIKNNIDDKILFLNIHGCSNEIRKKTKAHDLDILLSYGGVYSYCCELRIKDAFAYFLENDSLSVYEGKDKVYSAQFRDHLSQIFRNYYPDKNINSIQIKIIEELRSDLEISEIFAQSLIGAIDDLLVFNDSTSSIKRKSKFIN
jgi:hypothetical protein